MSSELSGTAQAQAVPAVSPEELALLFLNEARLAVAGALVVNADTAVDLVERTGLSKRAVLGALGDLRTAGFVTAEDGVYSFVASALPSAARGLRPPPAPMDPSIGYGMTDDEKSILGEYFTGKTLHQIPSSLAKLEVVAQRLALEFEPGERYPEATVNEMLGAFHPDTARLRRELIDLGFLDREVADGTMKYWRRGGRV